MIKLATQFIVLMSLLLGILGYAQERKKFSSIHAVLQQINPNRKVDSWVLVYNNYGKDEELKTSGKVNYKKQFSGFNPFHREDSFYYIAYSQGGKVGYVTDTEGLKKFIDKIDNAQEAAIMLAIDGYIIDEEFKDFAGNYYEDQSNYYLDLGKIISKGCPYQKRYYTITVSKSTGTVSNVKDNGVYIELYNKECTNNNPSFLKIENKKDLPKEDEPKKHLRADKVMK